jgi:hypothetical protein
VENLPAHLRISTFGIGKSFDEQLVTRIAKKGRGSVSRIYDLDQGSLSEAVVLALNRAMYPSLPGCSIKWLDKKKENLNEVFYNQIISSYRIFDDKDFDIYDKERPIYFTFECKEGLNSTTPFKQTFSGVDFKPVPAESGLFKMAAHHLIKNTIEGKTDSKKREKLSLKYQVLAPETAFVGVVREEGRIVDEVVEVEVRREAVVRKVEEKEEAYGYMEASSGSKKHSEMFGGLFDNDREAEKSTEYESRYEAEKEFKDNEPKPKLDQEDFMKKLR